MRIFVATLFVFSCLVVCSTVVFGQIHHTAWTMYIAIGPSEADILNGQFNQKLNIKRYKYPLYVGYFYTEDSKSVKYRCFEPIAEKAMNRWASRRGEPRGEVSYDVGFEAKSAKLGDDNYVNVAEIEILKYYNMRVIKITKGVLPDDLWRPQFKHQHTIGISLEDRPSLFRELDQIMLPRDESWTILN